MIRDIVRSVIAQLVACGIRGSSHAIKSRSKLSQRENRRSGQCNSVFTVLDASTQELFLGRSIHLIGDDEEGALTVVELQQIQHFVQEGFTTSRGIVCSKEYTFSYFVVFVVTKAFKIPIVNAT